MIFLVFQVVLDRAETHPSLSGSVQAAAQPGGLTAPSAPDEDLVAAPYAEYILTQGPHGYSYGHMAIDLTAGKGAAILAPINGIVTQKYVDEWGNPTLVIENQHYQVTLLHGKYTVAVDDVITVGMQIGTESNKGYTLDYLGQPCYNRDCGYHTHLNIYDKELGANVNPLDLISR